ncbi:hypothetical protein M0R45_024975 [Rubus argutus]|uniref:Uncharacterized protein n=1 Tax=Rubus argutus TaxID=59490 RepID=A0AAW1WVR3_RUBAR
MEEEQLTTTTTATSSSGSTASAEAVANLTYKMKPTVNKKTTEVCRKEVASSPAVLHQYNFTIIGVLGTLLQVKQAAGSPSPFVTDLVTMLMFIAVFLIYICSLATVEAFHFPNQDLSEFMHNISLLFGSLASILLLLILVRAFGFFTLSLWIVYFLIDFVTKKSYRNALGYFGDKGKELFKGLKVKELFKGQVKNEAENAVGLQEAGEQTTVGQLQDTQEITER